MRNFPSLYKLYMSLFAFTALLCFGSLELKAQFDPSKFAVVDRTANTYSNGFSSFVTNVGNNPHRYQLTGNVQDQRSVIWHSTSLNLTENFVIDFKLNFGNKHINGADGMAFILQQLGTNVIGDYGGNNLGYAGIGQQSFAVAFDTWNYIVSPGTPECFLYYLRNGSMNPIGQKNHIQDNGATVKTGLDYCVRISWTRNPNGSYDLTTYVVEYETGMLKERNKINFPNISSLFSGVSASNPNVIWGISAATGGYSNVHQVEFTNLNKGGYSVEPCSGGSPSCESLCTKCSDEGKQWHIFSNLGCQSCNGINVNCVRNAFNAAKMTIPNNIVATRYPETKTGWHLFTGKPLACGCLTQEQINTLATTLAGCINQIGNSKEHSLLRSSHTTTSQIPCNHWSIQCCGAENAYNYKFVYYYDGRAIEEEISSKDYTFAEAIEYIQTKKSKYQYDKGESLKIDIGWSDSPILVDITSKDFIIILGSGIGVKVCERNEKNIYSWFDAYNPVPDCPPDTMESGRGE